MAREVVATTATSFVVHRVGLECAFVFPNRSQQAAAIAVVSKLHDNHSNVLQADGETRLGHSEGVEGATARCESEDQVLSLKSNCDFDFLDCLAGSTVRI